jgi:acyl-CoA synthetase (AMP-forming)/AMP-acid ligase II
MTTRPTSESAGMTSTAVDHLPDRILHIAHRDPDRIALVHVRRPLFGRARQSTTTYGELSRRAEATAVGLRELGIREGTLCSFMVPPGEDAMVLALALWRVGAVMVGIEPHSHGMSTVARCLGRVSPEVFFGTPEAQLARRIFGWGRGTVHTSVTVGGPSLPGIRTLASLERPLTGNPQAPGVTPQDPAVIAFTTGSTGTPKPTVMTHQNLHAMIHSVTAQWALGEAADVVDMPTFPIFWIIGLSHGGTVVVPRMNFATKGPGQADPAELARTIHHYGVRSMFGSPALLTNLARHCSEHGVTLPSLRRVVAGGAEINGPLYASFKAVIPHGELYSNYGATEALPVAEIDGATVLDETWHITETGGGLCVGTPLPEVEVRIIEIDDDPIETMADARLLPAGQVGEIIVRSPHISDRYYDAPQEMRENKIGDGATRWHRVGDTGFLDERDRLWVCGRRSHRVVTEDRTYFPLCCEPVFNTHPDVVRSALIGLTRGGTVRAAMVLELCPESRGQSDRIADQLRQLAQHHDATAGIDVFFSIDRLPVDKRHNAKIDRPALATQFSSSRQLSRRGSFGR